MLLLYIMRYISCFENIITLWMFCYILMQQLIHSAQLLHYKLLQMIFKDLCHTETVKLISTITNNGSILVTHIHSWELNPMHMWELFIPWSRNDYFPIFSSSDLCCCLSSCAWTIQHSGMLYTVELRHVCWRYRVGIQTKTQLIVALC